MAKRGKAQPARRPAGQVEESALLRSAEALGRMIGALQRQLDGATKRLSRQMPERAASGAPLNRSNGHGTLVVKKRKPARAAKATKAARRQATPKSAATREAETKPRRTGTRKSTRRS
jgi:hypothetical protein